MRDHFHNGDCRDIMRTGTRRSLTRSSPTHRAGSPSRGEKWTRRPRRGFQSWCESWAVIGALRMSSRAFLAFRAAHFITGCRRDRDAGFGNFGGPGSRRRESIGGRSSAMLDRSAGVRPTQKGATSAVDSYRDRACHPTRGTASRSPTKPRRGLGVGLKPAWEPIVVARRPIEGRLIDNARAYGSGTSGSAMDAVGGFYPPNLITRSCAAAVDQARPITATGLGTKAEGPDARTPEGGGTTAGLPRSHAVPDPACRAGRDDPRGAVRRVALQAAAMEGERVGCELDARHIPLASGSGGGTTRRSTSHLIGRARRFAGRLVSTARRVRRYIL